MPKILFSWKFTQYTRDNACTNNSDWRGHDRHNPERTAQSPPDSYRMPGARVVKENFHGVIAQGIDVMLMVIRLDLRTERGFRGPGVPASCRYLQAGSFTMRIVPTFSNDNEKV